VNRQNFDFPPIKGGSGKKQTTRVYSLSALSCQFIPGTITITINPVSQLISIAFALRPSHILNPQLSGNQTRTRTSPTTGVNSHQFSAVATPMTSGDPLAHSAPTATNHPTLPPTSFRCSTASGLIKQAQRHLNNGTDGRQAG